MSIHDVLAELRKNYLDALPARADAIEKLFQERKYSEVETEFHKLKGTGKTYGLPEVSQIGEVAERLVENGSTSADESVPSALKVLRRIAKLRGLGEVPVLENDSDFLYLAELARELHETTSGRNPR
jgi:predicted metal-dependent phosphoesterase TrpH